MIEQGDCIQKIIAQSRIKYHTGLTVEIEDIETPTPQTPPQSSLF